MCHLDIPAFVICANLREIGDVDESVIEGREDAGNAKDEFTCRPQLAIVVVGVEHKLAFADLRTE
jgi:hypothetical protein